MKKMWQKGKAFLFACMFALVGVASSGLALAQSSGGTSFASSVTPQISTSQTDIVTIGGAVLVLLVVVAAIGWVARAMKK